MVLMSPSGKQKMRKSRFAFHAKMGTIKDRNGMDLTEALYIRKRWQEYTEEGYKNGHNDPDNQYDVITHLEPDIVECEVKWALGTTTTNQADLFQILKDDVVKVLYSICQQIWKTQQRSQNWKKVNLHSSPKEGQCPRMFKLPHNCTHFAC